MPDVGGMLGQPAGWYQDPAPANPDAPETVRFWDGMHWTGQVRVASKKERTAWRNERLEAARAYKLELLRRAEAGDYEAEQELLGPRLGPGTRNTTPDGQIVSGWWRRVFAELLDGFVIGLLGFVLSFPWFRRLVGIVEEYGDRVLSSQQAGVDPPPVGPVVNDMLGPLVAMVAIYFLLGLAYEVGFLKAFNATPGKLLLGLEVRMREARGTLSWGTVLVRWFAKRGYSILNVIPFVALLTGLYGFLDYLWPLWDSRRQALHDKMAATVVVRR